VSVAGLASLIRFGYQQRMQAANESFQATADPPAVDHLMNLELILSAVPSSASP
jgi:hypothetical protein